MNKAVSIDLNTNVDVGIEDIVIPGDKITFKRKNTEQYLGLLSNMTAKKGQGWMTTTNKPIRLISDDGTTAVLDINGKEFRINSSLKLIKHVIYEPKMAGDIVSVAADSNAVYYTIRDKLNNVYFIRHPYDDSGDYERLLVTATDEKSANAFFLKGSTNYVVATTSRWDMYDKDGNSITGGSLSFTRAPNNGYYKDASNYGIGRDENDQYYCWSLGVNAGTSFSYLYIGHFDKDGNITGEPFPCLGVASNTITYSTPTRLTNGVLRWSRLTNENGDLLRATQGLDYKQWDSKTIADFQSNPPNAVYQPKNSGGTAVSLSETGLNTWIMGVFGGTVASVSRTTPANHHLTSIYTRWIVTDPSANPGQFWSGSVGTYDNVFPYKYIYTNKQGNRGKTFLYGDGFVRCYVINGLLGLISDGSNWNLFDCYTHDVYLYENNRGTAKSRWLEANKSGNMSTYKIGSVPIRTIDNNGVNSIAIDSTAFDGSIRRHPFSSEQADNKAWNEWYYNIGGSNYGNESFISDLPWHVTYSNGLSLLSYNGYLMGFSWNKCLINTPNNEIEVWNYLTDGTNHYIVDKENVYILGAGELKIEKIADYIFGTNCITEYNALQESRGGVINLIRAFIPYNMSFEINSNFRAMSLKAPEDASAANDVWMMGAAVNANLKDDYLVASFLLPAISVPIYVNSVDMNQFDKAVIIGNQPLFKPVYSNLLFSDEELLHYYTHSQSSTDVIYRETIKGSDSYFNTDYEDNSWWITSTTVYFPIGIARRMTGINYMSSTIDLNDRYTARLYVANNQAYLVYNIAEQVYYGGTIFTIYTNSYYYDGEAIYSIVAAGQTEFVCYAIGLRFLGNSGTEAYFYSPYDKSIYLFSGSNTLSKAKSLARLGEITDSMFSSVNQRMYILDENSNVLWMSNESSGLYQLKDIDHLETSEKGAIMVGKDENGWNYTIYSPREDFDEVVPMELETGWIGDTTAWNKFGYMDIQLFSQVPVSATLKMTILTKDNTDIKSQVKTIEVKKSHWKGSYLKVRITPDECNGQAFKLKLDTSSLVHIMNMQVAFEEVSTVPPVAAINLD